MENRYCRYLCPRKRWTRKAGFLEKFSGRMSQIKPCTRTPSPDPKKGRIDSAAQAAIDTREDLGVWRSTPFIDPLAGEGCLWHAADTAPLEGLPILRCAIYDPLEGLQISKMRLAQMGV